jgi:hypothetical protein
MYRIDAIFDEIKPIVVTIPRRFHVALSSMIHERRVPRDGRRIIPVRSQVREYESAKLSDRVGKVFDLFIVLAVFGLRRLL